MSEDRRIGDERRGRPRGGRRLEDDDEWCALKLSVSQTVSALIATASSDNIAEPARRTAVAESSIQDLLKLRTDAKLSTLFILAKRGGYVLRVVCTRRAD